jgi:hypothetical protein
MMVIILLLVGALAAVAVVVAAVVALILRGSGHRAGALVNRGGAPAPEAGPPISAEVAARGEALEVATVVALPPEARARLDAHLDAVEKVLIGAGHAREQRRGVLDDLEAQILEMVARCAGSPGVGDVEAVLAQLDPPGAYGGEGAGAQGPGRPVRPHFSRTAIWGLVYIVVSVVALALWGLGVWMSRVPGSEVSYATFHDALVRRELAVLQLRDDGLLTATYKGNRSQRISTRVPVSSLDSKGWAALQQEAGEFGVALEYKPTPSKWMIWPVVLQIAPIAGPLGLLGTVLGWVALWQIRRSGGVIRGRGLALVEGVFYPVLIGVGLVVRFFA